MKPKRLFAVSSDFTQVKQRVAALTESTLLTQQTKVLLFSAYNPVDP